ncbi:hypothetical protein [Promicromonospora sp. NFX87]|uniref:hypothetical protein n=1 Tax=Promicromonospora sp. NFX87 TaxID=3402691 RepID=UPI003AFA56FA
MARYDENGNHICKGLACYLMAGSDWIVREGPGMRPTFVTRAHTLGLTTYIELADGSYFEVPERHTVVYLSPIGAPL